MKFFKNNIGFRCDAAAQYEHFYAAKRFMLTEVQAQGLSSSARETLLQYLSMASMLLTKYEYKMVESGPRITEDTAMCCREFAIEYGEKLCQVVREHPQDFAPEFAGPWLLVADRTQELVLNIVTSCVVGDNISTAFANIVDTLLQFLNYVMFIVHEIEDGAVLYVSQVDLLAMENGYNLCATRLSAYSQFRELSRIRILPSIDLDTESRIIAYRKILEEISEYNIYEEISR